MNKLLTTTAVVAGLSGEAHTQNVDTVKANTTQAITTTVAPDTTKTTLSGSVGATAGFATNGIGPTYHFNSEKGVGLNMITAGLETKHTQGGIQYNGKVSGLAGAFREQNYPSDIWSNHIYDLSLAVGDTSGTWQATLGQEGSNSIIGTFNTDQAQNLIGLYPEAANNSPYGLTNLRVMYKPGKGWTINLALTNGFQKTLGEFDTLTGGLNVTKERANGFYTTCGSLVNPKQIGIYPAVGYKDDTKNIELGGYCYKEGGFDMKTLFLKGGCTLSNMTVNGIVEVFTNGDNTSMYRGGGNLTYQKGNTIAQVGGGYTNINGSGKPFFQATISTNITGSKGFKKKHQKKGQR